MLEQRRATRLAALQRIGRKSRSVPARDELAAVKRAKK